MPAMQPAPPLRDQAVVGTDFTIAEWSDDGESSAARPIAPLHVHHGDDEAWVVLEGTLGFHHGDDEAWVVLEGTLGFIRGDERLDAPAGSAVLVPRGTPHTYWNAGGGRARYVIVMPPRIAALVAALHEPGARADLAGLFERFDSTLLA